MNKYFNNVSKIINPEYLFQNIQNFSFEKIMYFPLNDNLYDNVNKDIFKDIYIQMVDRNIELKYGEDYLEYISEFESNSIYLYLDPILELSEDPIFFYVELVNLIDINCNKFSILKDLLNYHDGNSIIVKFKEIARNTLKHPIPKESLDIINTFCKDYNT